MSKLARIAEALSYWPGLRTLFDSRYYLEHNPGVAEAGMNPLLHYVLHGASEGRKPHPLFDPSYYLSRSPEARKSSRSPLAHFVRSHGAACASPHPLFDCESYLLENPEAGRQNPLLHYVRSERRKNTATAPQAQIRGGRPVHFAPLDVMDVKLIVVFLETHFDAKTAEERNEIRMRLDGSAKRDRLAGTLVPVWKDREGRTRFLAPPQQRPFFQAIRYDQLRVQADRTFLCAFEM